MSSNRLFRYGAKLEKLHQTGNLRALTRNDGADFTSNDYLGLAASAVMADATRAAIERGVPVGAGGSRLLRGNHAEHEALEVEAAAFFRCERTLYFANGYAANVAVLSNLPQRGDLIVHDRLVHASAHEGMKASRADVISVAHNDPSAIEEAIRAWRAAGGRGFPWIVIESLYSMDGDRSNLSALMDIADRHDGFLFIDEAHATGVHGLDGIGYSAELKGRNNVIVLHTCGKALGVAGALVGCDQVICDFLVNKARSFIYSTAPSPLQAACVRQALVTLSKEPERRAKLHDLIDFANAQFSIRLGIPGSGSQILPVVIGDNGRTIRIADRMQSKGYDLRAIRPPTVPSNTARLRMTITLNVDKPTIAEMLDELARAIKEERT